MEYLVVYLEISSFLGSLGATHVYGHLITKQDYKKVELKRKLTEYEAEKLRIKDGSSGIFYHKGAMTERFNTEEEIIKVAKRQYQKIFPTAHILVKGRTSYIEPKLVLHVKKGIKGFNKKRANEIYHQAKELDFYSDPKNDLIMDRLNTEYHNLFKHEEI